MTKRSGTTYLRPEARERHLDPLIELLHVRKEVVDADGSTDVLIDDVSAGIARGELVALTGPAIAGKTALVNIMCGMETPTSGRVIIDNVDLTAISEDVRRSFRGRRIGVVRQWHFLLDELDVLENVALPLRLNGVASRVARESARRALEQCGVADRARDRVADLARSHQQRVALARAIVGEPAVVLADEPTMALESTEAESYFELLRAIRSNAHAIVVATRDLTLARYAPRRLHLIAGRVTDDEEDADP